ncbi:MAG TPA: serine/threonine-protein kinase [Kofleriaceae bacterium]|nr:serine/threonine-protein kinase [Kofleriaceae bacterium]
MAECIPEDDLLDLATSRRALGDAPAIEAHLADCAACSALLGALLAAPGAPGSERRRDLAGTTLGPYRLDGLIGAGAMGEVYRSWDGRLHRHVAVKLLSRQLADSPERIRRLEAEARAAAAIAHRNVVTVYDTGSEHGLPYVVSELITGESLRSVIDRGPIARGTALDLALQLARGVAAAHAQGVVHRDLKPGNLIVTDEGTLKILDFGLAKVSGERDVEATEPTVPGTVLGTSGYLSPEQARGEPADARSDIFAIGAVAYELLTGRRAFDGATFAERISAVLRDSPPPLDDATGPIVARCLEKDPRKRFQSANDLAWVLEGLARDDAPAPPSPSPSPSPSASPPARPMSRRAFVAGTAATGLGGLVAGALGARALAPVRRAAYPEIRQMTFRLGRVLCARFTRDGGSLVYAALWEELPSAIYVARLAGGGTRALALPAAQLLAVSSRGELALSLDHRFVEGFHQRGQLALAPLEGGQPRGLGIDVQDADFTPDGADLAVVRRVDGRFQLELPVGRILCKGGWISHPRVSPDGTLVACLVHGDPSDDRGDLVVVPRDGGPARTVAADWSSVDGVAWAPGGRALWISASRDGGNNSVRAIALAGGELSHLPSVGRLRVHDVAADGHLAVTHCTGRMRMMARAPGARDETDLALSDISLVGDISADGRSLVFVEFGDVDTANGAYLRPTDGGPALRLGDAAPIDIADDGRGVLAFLYRTPDTLAILPVPEGQPRTVDLPGMEALRWARWCAGDRILFTAQRPGRRRRLWRLDPDHSITPLTDEGVVGPFAVRADGTAAALISHDRLLIVDIAQPGPVRAVPGTFADQAVCGWSTGNDVLVRTRTPPIRVHRVDPATGTSTPIVEIAPPRLGLRGVDSVVVTPAGDAYAYSYGQELSRLFTMTTDDPGA